MSDPSAQPQQICARIEEHGGRPCAYDPLRQRAVPLRDDTVAAGSYVMAALTNGAADIEEVLAQPGSAQARLYDLATRHGLTPAFPTAVRQATARCLAQPGLDAPDLLDLTALAFCSIDDADTRDLDQAVYIETHSDGYTVYYALADAAWYVRPSSALFTEALQRGASYYLPGLSIPMLPRQLSEGLISLNPHGDRRAMVFILRLDQAGCCQHTRLERARIHSRGKLSFERVQDFLDQPKKHGFDDPALETSLRLLREVGELRLQDAAERDVVRHRRTEVATTVGPHGMRFSLLEDLRNDVELYNEQLSLLCNIEGARYLRDGDTEDDDIHPIYRIHPQPPSARMQEFERLVQALVLAHGLDPARWAYRHDGRRSLAGYLKQLPQDDDNAGIVQAIHRQAILTNMRSSFSAAAGAHYGVGAEIYARFSAPMREIVGVYLHKEAWEKRQQENPQRARPEDEKWRDAVIERANAAKALQRRLTKDANRLVIDDICLASLEGSQQVFTGTVLGIDNTKAHVRIDTPPMEIKVYAGHMREVLGARIDRDRAGASWLSADTGQTLFRVGDRVDVRVLARDEPRNRWKFFASATGPTSGKR